MMFSYGSGLASSMFTLQVRSNLADMRKKLNLQERLASRVKVDPNVYETIMDNRKEIYNKPNMTFKANLDLLEDGAFYLLQVDPKYRRTYARKSSGKVLTKNSLAIEVYDLHIITTYLMFFILNFKEVTKVTQKEESKEHDALLRLKMIQGHLKNSKPSV